MAAPAVASLLALALLTTGAAASRRLRLQAVRASNATAEYIPATLVRMPADYADYARGRTPIALFPQGGAPGKRSPQAAPAQGLPSFDPATSQEVFMEALPTDPIGHRCAPGGDAAGHYFYNVKDPTLVPYVLAKDDPKNTGAAIVIAPGGGSIHLAWEPEGISAAEWFNSIGVSAFVLKYRVPDDSGMLQLMDAQRAMKVVRSRAAGYGIDAARVGFMGSSAGGSLALRLQNSKARAYPALDAADALSDAPDFLVLNYPAIDTSTDTKPENVRKMPPTTFGFAEDDPCCPADSAHWLQAALEKDGASPHLIMDFPEGKHGWGSCDYYPQLRGMEVCSWNEQVRSFLEQVRII